MKAVRRAALYIIPLLLCVAAGAFSLTQRQVGNLLERATVKVSTYDGDRLVTFGSGFVFGKDGFVGTNWHVVQEAVRRNYRLKVEFVDKKTTRDAEVLNWDAYHDFAVIRMAKEKGKHFRALKIGDSKALRPLDTVFVGGFPVTGAYKAQRGELNSTQTYQERDYFDISPLIDRGNSGGPVLNGAGEVVGVSVAFVKMARSINLAVRTQDIRGVIRDSLAGKRKLLVRDGKEAEKNDERSRANLIVHGLAVQGRLSEGDDADWLEMNNQEGARPTITMTHGAGKDFDLEIYSDSFLTGRAAGKGESDTVTCHVPGRCFLKVVRKSGEGEYKIAFNPNRSTPDDGSEMEGNNVRALANRTRSVTLTGRLGDDDAEDWFMLEGQEGQQPSVAISHGGAMNFDFEVYSDMILAGRATGTGATDSISCNVPGRCYVRVYRVTGAGSYTVTIGRDAGAYREQEPNDDRSMANLTRSMVIEGSVSAEDRDDWFELAGQEGNSPSFTLRHSEGADFEIEVFSNETPVGRTRTGAASETLRCAVPGRCFVHVWRVTGSGNYTLTVDANRPRPRPLSADGRELEPNNRREHATMTRSMVLRGIITGGDEEDWFELAGQEGTRPIFTFTHDAGANLDLEVFSDGMSVGRATGTGTTEQLTCDVPGRCFVRVTRVTGNANYTVTISTPPPRPVNQGGGEVEPNNTRETATLTGAVTLNGQLGDNDTEDWFELAGQEGTNPSFTITHGQEANFDFEVFSNAVLMCRATATGATDTARCQVPGRCFVRVWRVSGAGAYTLQVGR
ncbi:MAG TPA: serine protease [Spirochaetota bacterium]|nr:serine protease [Spirochaetota bacterium]